MKDWNDQKYGRPPDPDAEPITPSLSDEEMRQLLREGGEMGDKMAQKLRASLQVTQDELDLILR